MDRQAGASTGAGHVLANTVRDVLGVHKPFKIYDECDHHHEYTEDGGVPAGLKDIENVGLVCEDGYQYSICGECCAEDIYQTETCATNHPHAGPSACWPCPTVVAVAAALGVCEDPED